MSDTATILKIMLLTLLLIAGFVDTSFAQKNKKKNKKYEIDESDRRAAEFYFIEGEKFFILEDYAKALSTFQKCLGITPENSAAYYKIAEIMYRNEQYPGAEQNVNKAILYDNTNKYYYLLAADIATAYGDFDKATQYYEEMLSTISETEIYYTELAGMYLFQNKLNEALETYHKAEEKYGISDQISLQKQQIYLKQNKIDEAILEGQKLVDAYPGNHRFVLTLAKVMHTNGKKDKAINLLADFLKIEDNTTVKLQLAQYYSKEDRHKESEQLIKESFADPLLDLELKTQVLVIYINRFPDSRAIRVSRELGQILIDTHPNESEAYLVNADMLATLNSLETLENTESIQKKSAEYYRKSLAYDQSNFTVWQNLMNLDMQLSRWDSIIVHAETALELFPNQPVIYLYAGMGYSRKKIYDEAVQYLEQGKKIAATNPRLLASFYSSLGSAYNALEDYVNSDKAYESAIDINPNDDIILNNYSYYLSLRKEKLKKARRMAQEVVRRNPDNATYLDTYAWVLFHLKEYKEAKRILEKVIQSNNANAVHYDHYGDVLFKLGNVNEAVINWQKAKKLDETIEKIEKKISRKKIFE